MAGRIHQMRSAKCYLAAHPGWFDEEPGLTCPGCGIESKSFQHPILNYPSHPHAQDLLLKEVTSVDADSPIWNHLHLIKALGQCNTTTKTHFPPEITLGFPFSSTPPTPLHPPEEIGLYV